MDDTGSKEVRRQATGIYVGSSGSGAVRLNYAGADASLMFFEITARLHHRLTDSWISNGNGRHARMMADLVIERVGGKAFSWGGGGRRCGNTAQ